MPEPQDPLIIPVPGDGSSVMAGEFALLHEQQMVRMGNIAAQAHENFTTWQDFAKLDHMEHKRTVSLVQAAGMRELQAERSPGGPKKPD